MFVLRWHIAYGEDNNWKEKVVTVEEETIENALQKYLREIGKIRKPIKLSRLFSIVNNEKDSTNDFSQ